MARYSSGGLFGKLVLIGLGAVIGAAMTQQKTMTGRTSQVNKEEVKASIKKGLDRLNEQSGGMVDKVKPTVNKAVEKVKTAIDAQQDMMNKEKEVLDKANKEFQDSTTKQTDSSKSDFSASTADSNKPASGDFGGSTGNGDSLKKNQSTSEDSTFGK